MSHRIFSGRAPVDPLLLKKLEADLLAMVIAASPVPSAQQVRNRDQIVGGPDSKPQALVDQLLSVFTV